MGIFGRRNRGPIQQPQPMREQQPQPKKEKDDCDIKVKRDAHGRIIGYKSTGKCSKEDREIFARENGVPSESIEAG